MSDFEDRIVALDVTPTPIKTLEGKPLDSSPEYVDPDTFRIGGQRMRQEGFNAPETAKVQGGIFVPGDPEEAQRTDMINRIGQAGGYTDVEKTGKTDNYGRPIVGQQNKVGDYIGDTLTALGVTMPTRYTSDETMAKQALISAIIRGMPDLANADPVLKIARENYEKNLALEQSDGRPRFNVKQYLDNEQEYAAVRGMTGIKAAQEQLQEIDRLNKILEDPNLRPDTRANLERQLEQARDRLFIAGTTPDFAGGVAYRSDDRTLMNQSLNQWTDSWNAAVDSVISKGLGGLTEMIGEGTQWEWLKGKAQEEVWAAKQRELDAPETLMSYKDIDTSDPWVATKDTATYLGNLFAGMLPHMGVMAASATAIGAAGVAGIPALALSSIPGGLIYAGQFYADQEDDKKNAPLALSFGISAGVLDRLGLEGLMGAGGSIFSRVGREAVIKNLMSGKNPLTRELAEAKLHDATKKTILEMAGAGAEFAKRHYASREARIAALKAAGLSSTVEGGTETAQTLLELVARTGEIDPDIRYEKYFNEALIDAAVGGGVMGGLFSAGGTAVELAQWHSVANAKKVFEGQLSENLAYQAQQRELAADPERSQEAFTSVLDAVNKVSKMKVDVDNLNDLTGKPGYWNGFKSVITNPSKAVRKFGTYVVPSLRKEDGTFKKYLPVLRAIMVNDGVLPGLSVEGFRQRVVGEMSTLSPGELATQLETDTRTANRMLKEAWQTTWSLGNRLPLTSPENEILQQWKDDVDSRVNKGLGYLAQAGEDVSAYRQMDPVFEAAAVDLEKLNKNQTLVKQVMMDNGASEYTAEKALKDIASGNPPDMAGAADVFRNHGVFRDARLSDLFEPDVFNSLENYKHRIASRVAKSLYLGEDGHVLAKILQLAASNEEFASEAERLQVTQEVKDFYKILEGEYNTLENFPAVEKITGWGVTAMMLASLGKAALSSIPEIAYSTLGTNGDKVVTQIQTAIKTWFSEYRSDFNAAGSYTAASFGLAYARKHPSELIRREFNQIENEMDPLKKNPTPENLIKLAALEKKVKKVYKKHFGHSIFNRLGFNDSGYNTQARFETNTANMKLTMQRFASAISLRALTDATRIATLSVGMDTLRTQLQLLKLVPIDERRRRFNTGKDLTNDQYQAFKELSMYGMDVFATLEALDKLDPPGSPMDWDVTEQKLANGEGLPPELYNQLMQTLMNLTNSRIVNPQVGNMPKFYYNPHLRIFTAMTRFIGAFTANILPRLYRDYIKDGDAGMRYQAFMVMAMALMFAFMANELKDVLAYGGDDENPYIRSGMKHAQRALYSSSILGRPGEAALNAIMPLYPNRKPDPTEKPFSWAYETFKDQAPPVSWGDRAVRAFYNLGTGETEKGVKGLVRSLPLVGSFPVVAEETSKLFKED